MNKQDVVITVVTPFKDDGSIDFNGFNRLVDYYLEAGAGGLFIGCQTGEALDMSPSENLAICEWVAKRVDGVIPIYAGFNRGPTLKEQIRCLKDVQQAGATEPVIWLSMLPKEDDLGQQTLQIVEGLEGLVGIYESPLPRHRLFTDADLELLSQCDRIGFFKDTCRDNDIFLKRLGILKGSTLRPYQANLDCLPQSLIDGAAGYSGILSGSVAQLCVDYVRSGNPSLHAKMKAIQSAIIKANHPASSKYLLKHAGLPISTYVRGGQALNVEATQNLDELVSGLTLPSA